MYIPPSSSVMMEPVAAKMCASDQIMGGARPDSTTDTISMPFQNLLPELETKASQPFVLDPLHGSFQRWGLEPVAKVAQLNSTHQAERLLHPDPVEPLAVSPVSLQSRVRTSPASSP